MKSLKVFLAAMALSAITSFMSNAQTADVTVVVTGIKEARGAILIAAGEQSKPMEMKYNRVEVTSTDDVTVVLKDVPVGVCGLFVFQDLNENFQLDTDEEKIPAEPCFRKEQITVNEGENKEDVKLMNVREMMAKKDSGHSTSETK